MNYAVITKAKAMHGHCFKPEDFVRLCECNTVEECAAVLKAHPAYARAFDGIQLRDIRLSRIEMLLKREYCIEFERLFKALSEKDSRLVRKLVGTHELDFIMQKLRSIAAYPTERAPYPMLYEPLIRKYSETDFDRLCNAQNAEQLAGALSRRYRRIAENAVKSDNPDYLAVENELWKSYYTELSDYIRKSFRKDDINTLLGTYIDIFNTVRIFRLREYFDYTADEIGPFILRPLGRLKESTVRQLCSSHGIKEFTAVLSGTPYRALTAAHTGEELEKLAYGVLTEKAEKALHFSGSAPAVIYAYMICKAIETDKIKTVIEAVRYNLSREMIENHVGTKAKADKSYRSGGTV